MATQSLNRVVEQKALGVQGSNLEKGFQRTFEAFRDLLNEIPYWGEEKLLVDEDGVLRLRDTEEKRRALYEKHTDKSLGYEDFKRCLRFLYLVLILLEGKRARGLTTSLFGGLRFHGVLPDTNILPQDAIKPSELQIPLDGPKNPVVNLFNRTCNTLRNTGFFNRAPFDRKCPQGICNEDLLSPSDCYIIVANISRIVKSWHEKDLETRESFAAKKRELEDRLQSLSNDERASLEQLFDFCLENRIITRWTDRTLWYLRDTILPNLHDGKDTPNEHFFLDRKGRKRDYSLHDGFYNYLRDHPILWKDGIEESLVFKQLPTLKLIIDLRRLRPAAKFPFTTDNTRIFQYLLGNNYLRFSLKYYGDPLGDCTPWGRETFTNGSRVQTLQLEANGSNVSIITRQRYKNSRRWKPQPYLQDLKVWTNGDGIYLFRFLRRDEEVTALLKEPSIVKRGENYLLRLNFTIPVETRGNLDQMGYLLGSSPIPSRRGGVTENDINKKRLGMVRGETVRVLGVDLGVTNPFAWASFSYTFGQENYTLVDSGVPESSPDRTREYRQLSEDIRTLKTLVSITRKLHEGRSFRLPPEAFSQTLARCKAFFEGRGDPKSQQRAEVLEPGTEACIDSLKTTLEAHNGDLQETKKDPMWAGSILLKYISLKFHKTKERRKFHLREQDSGSKLDADLIWVRIIRDLKKVKTSISYLGLPPGSSGLFDFSKLREYLASCRTNLLKQIAARVVQVAKEQQCDIIALESLRFQNRGDNRKSENEMLALWSPKIIQEAIKNRAEWEGILIKDVDERFTSQVHFETQQQGYREGGTLYYEEDGEIKSVHADINAAKNIAHRLLTRHLELPFADLSNGESKRMKALLAKHFGSTREARKQLEPLHEEGRVYRHGDRWISPSERKKIKEKIQKTSEIERLCREQPPFAARSI